MLSDLRRRCCGWSFHETLFHAYTELAYFFGVTACVTLAFALWGVDIHNHGGRGSSAENEPTAACRRTADAVEYFWTLFAVETVISGLVAISISTVMRTVKWALFALVCIALLVLFSAARIVLVAFGAVWVWVDRDQCSDSSNPFSSRAFDFAIATVAYVGTQTLLGSLFVFGCGLTDAVREGIAHVKEGWAGDNAESKGLLESSDEEDEHGGATTSGRYDDFPKLHAVWRGGEFGSVTGVTSARQVEGALGKQDDREEGEPEGAVRHSSGHGGGSRARRSNGGRAGRRVRKNHQQRRSRR